MIRLKTKHRKRTKGLPKNKKLILFALLALGIVAVSYWAWTSQRDNNQTDTGQSTTVEQKSISQQTVVEFDKTKYSLNDPASLWVVVNKGRQLPSSYTPVDLIVPDVALRYSSGGSEMTVRRVTADSLAKMFEDAGNQGIKLMLASGYRSYSTQSAIYNRHVRDYGVQQADRVSARPGHSEHQTGWSLDVEPASRACEIAKCFAELPEGQWLAANSYRFGFIVRYPAGKESLTGYDYEPWHIRYVGTKLAAKIYESGMTFEQFMGLPVFLDYPPISYQLGS